MSELTESELEADRATMRSIWECCKNPNPQIATFKVGETFITTIFHVPGLEDMRWESTTIEGARDNHAQARDAYELVTQTPWTGRMVEAP